MHATEPKGDETQAQVSVEIQLAGNGHVRVTLGISGDLKEDPIGYIRAVSKGVESLSSTLEDAVHTARRQRFTWNEIGDALGITRQSAWEKYAVE